MISQLQRMDWPLGSSRVERLGTGSWDNLIVLCAASYWSGTRLLDQHLAQELTAYGPVLYVEPPVSPLTRLRNREAAQVYAQPPLRQIEDHLAILSPRVLPLKERPGGKQLSLAMTRSAMRATVRRLGVNNVHAVIVPSLNPLFRAVDERFSVFYACDDYQAGASLMGIAKNRLATRAIEQPRAADIVVATSIPLAESFERLGLEPLFIPNGCDADHFGRTGLPPIETSPTVGFVGHLSNRVDVDLLYAIAQRGIRVIVAGPVQETMARGYFEKVVNHENVTWLGAVPYERLPQVLSETTSCVVPYVDNDFNRASFPLKALEYLAAGRRVVSTNIPAMRWLDTDLVKVTSNPMEFVEAVEASLLTPLEPVEVAIRRRFAARHTWAERVGRLAAVLQLSPRPVHDWRGMQSGVAEGS